VEYFCAAKPQSRDLKTVQRRHVVPERCCNDLLRDNFLVKDLNGRKKQTTTIKPKPSEANQPKPQSKALTAIKPEANKPKALIM